jgi:AcrR family transcriptional regulator
VPTGVIYYFRNKEELAAACFLCAIERYRSFIAAGADQEPGSDRVRAFVHAFFDLKGEVALGRRDDLAKFNDVRALNNSEVNDAYTAMFRAARQLVAFPKGAPAPRLHENARTHLLLSEMFWIVAWIRHVDVEDYPRAADRLASILSEGFMPPGAAWPDLHSLELATPQSDTLDPAEQFLRAATQLINEEGYHGASVERISARLNVSKGAFYHHNTTKDELVLACFKRAFDIMWRAIRQAEAAGGSGLQMLASVAAALVRYQLEGAAPLLRTSAFTTVPEALQPALMAEFDRVSYRFASMICDGMADGSIRPLEVNIGAQMLTTMINAAAELHYWAPGVTPQTAVDHYVRPFFQGLFATPAQ